MNCFNCGNPVSNGDAFCLRCGASIENPANMQPGVPAATQFQSAPLQGYPYQATQMPPAVQGGYPTPSPQGGRPPMQCPRCGYPHCQILTEASTEGKDFHAGRGCLGAICLGPIGLLCGACGKGKQMKTTNYFYCPNCGNRYSV